MSDRSATVADMTESLAQAAARIIRAHIERTETFATRQERAGLDGLAGRVDAIGQEIAAAVLDKRRDEPERAPRLTYPEAQHLKGALGVALIDGTAETARMVTAEEYGLLQAAIDRATLQPSECSHDDFEFPMHACPRCGRNF